MHINGPKSQGARNEASLEVVGMKIQHFDTETSATSSMTSRLIAAIQHGPDDARRLEELIKEGNHVNQMDRNKTTPVHVAAEKGYVKCLDVLVNHHANLNVLDDYGYSPLMRACRNGKCKAFTKLLDAGADISLCNETGQNVAHFCAFIEDAGCLDIILQHPDSKKIIEAKDSDGNTPLLSSLTYVGRPKDTTSVVKLLEAGANVSVQNSYGLRPLHYAASHNTPDMVHKILDKGCDINVEDKTGQSAFVLSVKCGNAPAMQALIERGCDTLSIDGLNATALSMATLMNHIDCVRILLDNGEDPDDLGYFGQTSLMGASYQSNYAMVDLLLKANADPNIVSRQGTTALVNSLIKVTPENVRHRHDVVKCIVRAGADVNYRVKGAAYYTEVTNGRNCPLSFAMSSGYLSLVNIMMNAGAEVSAGEIEEWRVKERNGDNMAHFYSGGAFICPLKKCYQTPRNLKHICRAKIRESMGIGTEIERAIKEIRVPKLIKDYLNFSDLDNIGYDDETLVELGDDPHIYQPTPTVMACGLQAIEREFGFHKFSSESTTL